MACLQTADACHDMRISLHPKILQTHDEAPQLGNYWYSVPLPFERHLYLFSIHTCFVLCLGYETAHGVALGSPPPQVSSGEEPENKHVHPYRIMRERKNGWPSKKQFDHHQLRGATYLMY